MVQQVTQLKNVKTKLRADTNEVVTAPAKNQNEVATMPASAKVIKNQAESAAAATQDGEVTPYSPQLPLHYPLLSFIWDTAAILGSMVLIHALFAFTVSANGLVPAVPAFPAIGLFVGMTVVWLSVFGMRSLYVMQKNAYQWRELVNVIQSVIISSIASMGALYLLSWDVSRTLLLQQALVALVFVVSWRSIYHAFAYTNFVGNTKFVRRVLVVGSQERISSLVTTLRQVNADYIDIVGFVTNAKSMMHGDKLGGLDDELATIIKENDIDDVVTAFTHPQNDMARKVLNQVLKLPVRTYTLPDYMDVNFSARSVSSIDQTNLVNITIPKLKKFDLFLKRAFDILVSSVALMLAGPVMAMIALAIKLEGGGSVLFVQHRMGYGKEEFPIFKFRSMRMGADKELDTISEKDENGRITQHKRPDDPRVTRIGKIIRKTSLDELPQIFNVLRGDMTLVGPRPEILRLVSEYEPWQDQRFLVKQGITGWWQVNGRSKNPCHLSTHQDVEYINNYSFLLDIQIILMTVPALLKGKGAF